jgi:hypothetical protein
MLPKERKRWDRHDLTGEDREKLLQRVRYRWERGERPVQSPHEIIKTEEPHIPGMGVPNPEIYPKGNVAHTRGWEPGDPLDHPASKTLLNGIEQSQKPFDGIFKDMPPGPPPKPRDERGASSTRPELDTFWKPIDAINEAALRSFHEHEVASKNPVDTENEILSKPELGE